MARQWILIPLMWVQIPRPLLCSGSPIGRGREPKIRVSASSTLARSIDRQASYNNSISFEDNKEPIYHLVDDVIDDTLLRRWLFVECRKPDIQFP